MRTFVAIDLEDVASAAMRLINRLSTSGASVRWASASQMHLTLKFLGEVDLNDVPNICQAVAEAVQGSRGFEIELHGAGAFPDVQRPRTLWLGVTEGSAELRALHGRLDAALYEQGYPPERRQFNPHLTIGRVRGGDLSGLSKLLQAEAEFEGARAAVDEVAVYQSELHREGPHYTVLSRCELRRDGAEGKI